MSLEITKHNDVEGLYGEQDSYPFLPKEDLKNRKYTLYAYVNEIGGKIYVKFGEAFKQSIYDRYNSTGHTAWQRMIKAWASEIRDKPIQSKLRQRSKNNIGFKPAPFEVLNTAEAFEIESEEGLKKFLNIIDEESHAKTFLINKKEEGLYPDVEEFVTELLKDAEEYNLLSLCPRYSKTRMTCEIIKRLNEFENYRIGIMCSYVGTVRTSYIRELNSNLRYTNIKFIDPDNYKNQEDFLKKEITNWLNADPNNVIMFYVAMTGQASNDKNSEEIEIKGKCFARRTKVLKELNNFKSCLFVEEADFGCHCVKQAVNIQKLYEEMHCEKFLGMTGTNAERILKIFSECKSYIKDYILDILPNRENATKIYWHVLTNTFMANICGKNVMENWNEMLSLNENKEIKGSIYVEKLFKFLFEDGDPSIERELRQKLRDSKLIDRTKATMVFVPNKIEIMFALQKLLEQTLGNNYIIKVINGSETTNKDAEEFAKQAIKDAGNRRVIFIAAGMANRSFSVSEIKNIILLINSGEFGSILQKIARGLTPYGEDGGICRIIDFRMTYGSDCCLSDYLAGLGVAAIEGKLHGGNLNESKYILEILSSGKIIFDEYDANEITPFRKLTEDELLTMMHGSPHFFQKKVGMILCTNNDDIKEPVRCDYNIAGSSFLNDYVNNKNVKGDQNKKRKVSNKSANNDKKEKEDERKLTPEEKKLQHWYFLVDFANLFMSDYFKYDSDKLFNEITNMSEERKKQYEIGFGIDMDTIQDIVKVVHKDGFDLDILLNLNKRHKDKRLIVVKGTLSNTALEVLWDLLKFNEIRTTDKILLAFLGNTYFYKKLIENSHKKDLIYIIEEEEFRCLYQDLKINEDHIKFVNFNNEKRIKETFNMNFDKTIMNPPWGDKTNTTIGQNILKHVLTISKEIVCLYGESELYGIKNKHRMDQFKHCDSITLIDSNSKFNIISRHGAIIAHFDSSKEFDTVKISDEIGHGWSGTYEYKNLNISHLPKKTVDFFETTKNEYDKLMTSSIKGGMVNLSNSQFEYFENKLKDKKHSNFDVNNSKFKFILNKTSYENIQDPYFSYIKNEGGITWTCATEQIKDNMYYWLHDCPITFLWRKIKIGGYVANCCAYKNIPAVDFSRKDFKEWADSLADNFNKKYTIEQITKEYFSF